MLTQGPDPVKLLAWNSTLRRNLTNHRDQKRSRDHRRVKFYTGILFIRSGPSHAFIEESRMSYIRQKPRGQNSWHPVGFYSLMSLFQANEKWTSLFSKISRTTTTTTTTTTAAASPSPTSSTASSSSWKKFHRACRKWAPGWMPGSEKSGEIFFATSGQFLDFHLLRGKPSTATVWYDSKVFSIDGKLMIAIGYGAEAKRGPVIQELKGSKPGMLRA